ncbi:MAG: hypothetical protein QOG91_587 [Candidatus Parcubacteria bacterium]|nr:hypothetical protein [Candidatus Parcubacteria bacterium]
MNAIILLHGCAAYVSQNPRAQRTADEENRLSKYLKRHLDAFCSTSGCELTSMLIEAPESQIRFATPKGLATACFIDVILTDVPDTFRDPRNKGLLPRVGETVVNAVQEYNLAFIRADKTISIRVAAANRSFIATWLLRSDNLSICTAEEA